MCEEYSINVPYARARYNEHKRRDFALNEKQKFDELNFIYGNNGFSETLAKDTLRKHQGNYLNALEEIINEE